MVKTILEHCKEKLQLCKVFVCDSAFKVAIKQITVMLCQQSLTDNVRQLESN